ncbi:uncharacterized protein LOC129236958 [Anastrepha obliqua]|uniref:uncharacterized protein LOC129236958 n=1 Tax=Anastrepha obliqua TaxID=95512 RepID=UPI0024093FDD|nr:uncharacterized protein LOC129236958 [Anastrepha obliqua]XP_054727267.1 uncharacterized protein LOC129236958 [Anastrepha obliqua]
MLKWALNTPRLSYLTETDSKANSIEFKSNTKNKIRTPSARRQRLKRKSSDFCPSHRLQNWLEKENQLEERSQVTSTPLHSTSRSHGRRCPIRRLNSLKDLSNITPYEGNNPSIIPKPISLEFNTPTLSLTSCGITRKNPSNYAATLPTLEVEYSPCGFVPGPILALRGLGIADTYFDKPRYLSPDEQNQTLIQPQPTISTTNSTFQSQRNTCDDTVSLSSSKMGDQTLERMIDAILESTRKEKKSIKFAKPSHHHQRTVMSPTYTPAEDPANDLSEFWSENQNKTPLTQPRRKRRRSLPVKMAMTQLFSEREVRSPLGAGHRMRRLQDSNFFPLRRQRVVRRKRNTSKSNGKTTKLSPHEIVEATEVKVSPELAVLDSKTIENSSPDSGHNSCSELDENTLEDDCLTVRGSLENTGFRALDATKRRLSFSTKTMSASQ